MRERDEHLVDDAVRADGARQQPRAEGRRVAGDEEVAVEAQELRGADAAGQGRDVVDVGVGDHGF